MIEIKANTEEGHGIGVEINVNASAIEYGSEALAIINSLMGALKKDDLKLHQAVLGAIADEPKILLGENISDSVSTRAESELANLMSKAIIKKGVN